MPFYTLPYYIKSNYGRDAIYFATECEEAEAILQLTGKKTLSREDLKALKTIGIEAEQVVRPLGQERI